LILVVLLLFLGIPFVSAAEINLILSTQTIDMQMYGGERLDVPAKLTNNGACILNCVYKRASFPGDDFTAVIGKDINPGFTVDFVVNVLPPECQEGEACKIPVYAICNEQIAEGCQGQKYEDVQYIEFTNVKPGTETGRFTMTISHLHGLEKECKLQM